jgi:hypothetical protein
MRSIRACSDLRSGLQSAALWLVLGGTFALAQSGAGGYHIAGTVANAVTGEPVRGATVAVLALLRRRATMGASMWRGWAQRSTS